MGGKMSDQAHKGAAYSALDDELSRITAQYGMTNNEHKTIVGTTHKAATNMFSFGWFAAAVMSGVAWRHDEMWRYAAVYAIGQWSVHGDAQRAASEGIKAMGTAVTEDCYGHKYKDRLYSNTPWSAYGVEENGEIPLLERHMFQEWTDDDDFDVEKTERIRAALVEACAKCKDFGSMTMLETVETLASTGSMAETERLAGVPANDWRLGQRLIYLRKLLEPLYQVIYGVDTPTQEVCG